MALVVITLVGAGCSDIIVTSKPDNTRFGTAATLATEAYPDGADVAVLAGGGGFADALAAAPLAAAYDAPILLAQSDRLPGSTTDTLDELDTSEVILLGGTGVISQDVQDSLSKNYVVTRRAGDDRYATAAAVAAQAFPDGADVALLATGRGFADALAAAPLARAKQAPILLTDTDGVPGATLQALDRLGISRIVLLGGTGVIDQSVEDALAGGPFEVTRVAGRNRFDTAATIAEQAFPDGADVALVAAGDGFADALAAAPLAASLDAPILLTDADEVPEATSAALEALGVSEVELLGGTAAIPDAIEQTLAETYDVSRFAGG